MNHDHFMHRCIELAQKGRGLVGINPLVGSVLVRDGQIIAEGFYEGADHAERVLIKNCDQTIQQTDRLYVNLEPCCHTGNTPPCTDLIIESGIKHVVIGMMDPDERVSGQGIHQLIDSGVQVTGPVLRAECERLNRGYISLRTNNRPYITLKRAQTREGKVANDDGSKLCITSREQNEWSHTYLRSTHDAILVGVQTVIVDDPQLNIRIKNCELGIMNQPYKIILDPDLRIPRNAKLIDSNTIIIVNEEIRKSRNQEIKTIEERGASVISIPIVDNHFDWDALWKQFSIFNLQSSISSILVEGGPKTWESFKKYGLADEEVVLVG